MSTNTKIEWATKTWGPILGCDKVSAGCKNCYAIRTAHRLGGNPNAKIKAAYAGLTKVTPGGALNWTGLVRCLPERLEDPLRWRKPERIFVNSQSDLFHEDVPFDFIDRVFAVMALCPRHTFQILTKRPARMREYLSDLLLEERVIEVAWQMWIQSGKIGGWCVSRGAWPLPNVWLGVSVEDQETANERVPLLLQVPAAVRFLSCEPLLGPIELWGLQCGELFDVEGAPYYNALRGFSFWGDGDNGHRGPQIHWLIVGGESGPLARPMHPDWARSLRDQCEQANRSNRHTAFFFKQHGEWIPESDLPEHEAWAMAYRNEKWHRWADGTASVRVGKKVAGRLLDGVEHSEFPRVEMTT